jgi:hypothetical protein
MGKGFTWVVCPLLTTENCSQLIRGFQGAVHRVQEVVAMKLRVKPDQIRAEQSKKKFPLPRTDPEGFGVWPGDVPENSDASVGPAFFKKTGQKREVIVLNEDARVFHPFQFIHHSISKFPVGGLVLSPILGAKEGPSVGNMAEGPKAFV